MAQVLCAAAAAFATMVAVFFFRFWRDSRDRFFLLFAGAFAVLATHWSISALVNIREHSIEHYTLRLCGFLLILVAIVDKNRRSEP